MKSLYGEETTIRCPVCGHDEPESEHYCGQCGSNLDDSSGSARSLLDDSSSGYYYTYTWFGERHSIVKWRWDLGIISLVTIGLLIGILYLSIGIWPNAIIIMVTMLVAAWIYHIIGKRKYGIAALFAVGLITVAGMSLASVPWQTMHAEYVKDKYEPKFTDTIGYAVENGTHVTCDGDVTNYGRTGSKAFVQFKAFGGFPNEGQDMFDGFMQGSVVTDWIAPNGGTTQVHWECNLGYFNGYGSVTWTIEPTG